MIVETIHTNRHEFWFHSGWKLNVKSFRTASLCSTKNTLMYFRDMKNHDVDIVFNTTFPMTNYFSIYVASNSGNIFVKCEWIISWERKFLGITTYVNDFVQMVGMCELCFFAHWFNRMIKSFLIGVEQGNWLVKYKIITHCVRSSKIY